MKQLFQRSAVALCAAVPLTLLLGSSSPAQEETGGGIQTLFARGDSLAAMSFREGTEPASVRDGQIDLADTQLVYGAFAEDWLSFGYVHDELVRVIDLGNELIPSEKRSTDMALEFPVTVYETLQFDGAQFRFLVGTGRMDRLREADDLLSPMLSGGLEHIEPLVGHTYVIRFRRRTGGREDRIAKFQVLEVRKGESVTLRWEPLAVL